MVSGQVVVDGVGQHPESVVEEVDNSKNNADEEPKLTAGPHLRTLSRLLKIVPRLGSLIRFVLS